METPLLDLLLAEDLGVLNVSFKPTYSGGVVLASQHYPYGKTAPKHIFIKDFASELGHIAFAGVELNGDCAKVESHTESSEKSHIESSAKSMRLWGVARYFQA